MHFAAESHVDRSIHDPSVFLHTNVIGTQVLLGIAHDEWGERTDVLFHHVSTDEVYGSLGSSGYLTELSPYAPNSPYSASKASGDMLVRAYHHTYGLNTVITNCSNNYGPKQHDEKLIPTIIRNALHGNPIPIYGDGKNVRDWLYVLDHCKGIDVVFHKGKAGQTYLIGGHNEHDNNAIAKKICSLLDSMYPVHNNSIINEGKRTISSYADLIHYVEDRPGHDKRYAIDPGKIEQLEWHAEVSFDEGLAKTVQWYVTKYV